VPRQEVPIALPTLLEAIQSTTELSIFASALADAEEKDLLDGESRHIVFAPTDTAFGVLPAALLHTIMDETHPAHRNLLVQHHLTPQELELGDRGILRVMPRSGQRIMMQFGKDTLTIGDVPCTTRTVKCSNGTLLVIGHVILPEFRSAIDVLREAGKYNTFLSLVHEAKLEHMLTFKWTYTIFIPTDTAFEALRASDAATAAQLSNPEALERFIKSIVVFGKRYRDDMESAAKGLATGHTLQTFGGQRRVVRSGGSGKPLLFDNCSLGEADVESANGLIHTLEAVPPIPR